MVKKKRFYSKAFAELNSNENTLKLQKYKNCY